MFQILMTLLIYMVLVVPVGIYLHYVATKQETFANPVFNRIDNQIYEVCRTERGNMNWKTYALNLFMTNTVMILIGYLVLRLQRLPFLNSNKIRAMKPTLSRNTIISFMTNANLQHYFGESGLTYPSRMVVIIFMMFTSAATGYAAYMASCRGISGRPTSNFYEDMIRNTTCIPIPIVFIVGLILIWQGTPQNFQSNFAAHIMEGKLQNIAAGLIAALGFIERMGTNGGGFLGANSSTPLENPTIISNIAELYSMVVLPGICVTVFGCVIVDKRRELGKKTIFGKQGKIAFVVMVIISMAGPAVYYVSEKAGNSIFAGVGLNQDMGSYEGKEVWFEIVQSALFTIMATSFTTETVNNIHDTLTPLGGLVPLLHMMFNCVFGGKDVGPINMVMHVILAVFISGLMTGRIPECLDRKIEGREMKLAAVCPIIHPLLVLDSSALAISTVDSLEGTTNPGFHGPPQVLYGYSPSVINNGFGSEGPVDNSVFWNMTAGLAMYFGRFPAITLQLAIARSILAKREVNETIGTLRTDNVIFILILVFVVYVFAALASFSALALGPIAEHLTAWFPAIG